MYIDKLDHIANTYNNSHHSTIKVMSVDINSRTYKTLVNTLAIKILNLKLVILLEYQNIKTYLQKAMFQIGLKKLLSLKKLKSTLPWTFTNSDCKGEDISGTFYEKELQIHTYI